MHSYSLSQNTRGPAANECESDSFLRKIVSRANLIRNKTSKREHLCFAGEPNYLYFRWLVRSTERHKTTSRTCAKWPHSTNQHSHAALTPVSSAIQRGVVVVGGGGSEEVVKGYAQVGKHRTLKLLPLWEWRSTWLVWGPPWGTDFSKDGVVFWHGKPLNWAPVTKEDQKKCAEGTHKPFLVCGKEKRIQNM